MPVTKEQAQMLTTLAIACRPHRAPTWDEAGVMAQLVKMREWSLPEVALRVIVCAADREAQTPAVIAAPGTRIPELKAAPYQPNVWDPADICTACSQRRHVCESRPRVADDDHTFVSRAAATGAPFETVQRAVAGLRDVKATEAPHERPEPATPEPNPHVGALRAEMTKEDATHG